MRLDRTHSKRRVELGPERRARPKHHGMDDELVLVHQPAAHELARQVRSTDVEVAVKLPAQVLEA